MKSSLLAFFLFLTTALAAQNYTIRGTLMDDGNIPLPGAHVELLQPWGEHVASTVTESDGRFVLRNVPKGGYKLKASYLGFDEFSREVTVSSGDVNLGAIKLASGTQILNEVEIKDRLPMAGQAGDTVLFNANAFKVMKDASAGELLEKLPTVTIEGGKIQAQGEDVRQVLVDGRPFFGNDPMAAVRNLPAEVIDRIQIFDQMSDQAQFTGFNDGNTSKTINIVTRPNMRVGQFGKVYAGYGSENKYQTGGNINIFNGDRRISFIGMSNNVNIQNFSTDDILGMMSGGAGGRGGGGMGGGGMGGGGGMSGGGGFGRGGGSSDFMVQQQGGIATTHAFGINYSDKWGKKTEATGSYFFNKSNGDAETFRNREYVDTELVPQIYTENSLTSTGNFNHRVSFRIETTIDSFNSFILRPRLSLQNNQGFSSTLGETLRGITQLNETDNIYNSDLTGVNFTNSLVFRHKFKLNRRTFSIDLNNGYAPKKGDSDLFSENKFYSTQSRFDTTNQQSTLDLNSWNMSTNFAWTEPITENAQLMLNYQASFQQEESDKQAYDFVQTTQRYDDLNEQLTNIFSNDYFTHQAGVGYNYAKGRDMNLMIRGTFQHATLTKTPEFPAGDKFDQKFTSVLPFAMLRYNITPARNIRVFYRTNTQLPSVEQLQYVLDNTNPLLLRVGNPGLGQSYQQSLFLRYQATNTAKSTVFFAMIGGGMTNNHIANSTFTSKSDDPIFKDFNVLKGAQISQPVNLNGYYNIRSFVTYGVPIKPIKSNLNFNLTYTYSKSPGLINDALNYAHNNVYAAGLTLASNISTKIDFTLSSRSSISKVTNTLQTGANSSYWNQSSRARLNWIIIEGFVLRTDLTHQYNNGLSQSFDENYFLWNLGIGKKVLKNGRGELTLSVNDFLNQNRNISRNVTDSYFEDVRTNDLTRYVMLTFTYNLRHFRVGSEPVQEQRNWPGGGERPPFIPH